ncbi:hypothetical protein FQA39_LY06194 [Lamprigera yunnana]|nr:hypothetical protein FQA39_LY06194 [Lamprigera yunnana]
MVSRFESKYRKFGHVRDLAKSGRPSPPEDQLNVMLAIQENHHSTLNHLTSNFNSAASTVYKIIKKRQSTFISKEENSGTALYKNMSFRLPTDVKPLHYDLTFKPNLQNGTFEGRINITLKILRPRRNIVLHNNNLTITNVSLVFSNQSQLLTVISEETNKVLESTTVNVQEDILPGIYYLNINFTGNMLDKLVGLYRSIYTDKLTNTKR